MMAPNEAEILKGFIGLLEKLIYDGKSSQKENANKTSLYCEKILNENKTLPEEVEELLVACLDLNHWGWEELPPTQTIDTIKDDLLPHARSILGKR